MKKRYLLAPGPTPVPASVLLRMASPIIHHRTPEFSEVFRETAELLKYVFQTGQGRTPTGANAAPHTPVEQGTPGARPMGINQSV